MPMTIHSSEEQMQETIEAARMLHRAAEIAGKAGITPGSIAVAATSLAIVYARADGKTPEELAAWLVNAAGLELETAHGQRLQ